MLLGQGRLARFGPSARRPPVRNVPDQMFDHFAAEYTFADGTRLLAQGRHLAGCWGFFGDVIHGSKGSALLGEGQPKPHLYRGHAGTTENVIWQYQGPPCNPYQREHDLLFEAIRQDKPYNETERWPKAALTGILGRMAADPAARSPAGALDSPVRLAPGLEKITSWDCPPPVMPDAKGHYPIAMPGITKVL